MIACRRESGLVIDVADGERKAEAATRTRERHAWLEQRDYRVVDHSGRRRGRDVVRC